MHRMSSETQAGPQVRPHGRLVRHRRQYEFTEEERPIVQELVRAGILKTAIGLLVGGGMGFGLTRFQAVRSRLNVLHVTMITAAFTLTGGYIGLAQASQASFVRLAQLENSALGREARIVLQDYDPKKIAENRRLRAEQEAVQDANARR